MSNLIEVGGRQLLPGWEAQITRYGNALEMDEVYPVVVALLGLPDDDVTLHSQARFRWIELADGADDGEGLFKIPLDLEHLADLARAHGSCEWEQDGVKVWVDTEGEFIE